MELQNTNQEISMSSLDFLNDYINPARMELGQNPVQNNQFVKRVADELDLDETQKLFELGKTGHRMPYFTLDYDQMMLVGMRESKAVRKAVLAKLKQLQPKQQQQRPMSHLEILRDAANALVEQDQKLKELSSSVQEMQMEAAQANQRTAQLEKQVEAITHYTAKPIPKGYVGLTKVMARTGMTREKLRRVAQIYAIPVKKHTSMNAAGYMTELECYPMQQLSDAVLDVCADATRSPGKEYWNHPELGRFKHGLTVINGHWVPAASPELAALPH